MQALYRIVRERHRFEPAIRYVNDAHDGKAIANQGFSLRLTYLYLSPKVVLDANVGYGRLKADESHPVYDETIDTGRLGVALTAFIPVRVRESSRLSVFVGGEVFRADANIDFFDSRIASLVVGLLWRHLRT